MIEGCEAREGCEETEGEGERAASALGDAMGVVDAGDLRREASAALTGDCGVSACSALCKPFSCGCGAPAEDGVSLISAAAAALSGAPGDGGGCSVAIAPSDGSART